MSKKSLNVAYLAVILGLTFLCAYFSYVFLVPLIIASICLGRLNAFIASCMFAGVSILYVFTLFAGSPISQTFMQYPYLAILPRLPIGTICYYTYKGMCRLTRGAKNTFVRDVLPMNVAATVASLTNTVLVVGAMVLFLYEEIFLNPTIGLTLPMVTVMGCIEVVAVNVIVPPIAYVLKKYNIIKLDSAKLGVSIKNKELEKELEEV